MKLMPFKPSSPLTLGIELEYQIINPKTFGLISRAKDLLRNVKESDHQEKIKPEITQSMIEINSSIHTNPQTLQDELTVIHDFLLDEAKKLNIRIAGGGTHPFHKWEVQKIFPSPRFKNLSRQYRYLSKQSTVFGLHIHIGCANCDDALYLTHALARYVPQLIAMSASSPFYQGVDTGYHSARSNIFNVFPSSGVIPYFINWQEFSAYFFKMKSLGIAKTMKDLYWEVRPKPEFGTVEIRVCDTPLTVKKAVMIAAYAQALANYLLTERPNILSPDLYYLYSYNRFQAVRYGFDGLIINPVTLTESCIYEDIDETFKLCDTYIQQLNNMAFVTLLMNEVHNKRDDTSQLLDWYKQTDSLAKVVENACNTWQSK